MGREINHLFIVIIMPKNKAEQKKPRELGKIESEQWALISSKLAQASALLSECQVILHCNIQISSGKPADKLDEAIDALSGLSYLFMPQPEWIGGDSSNPKNFKMRPPHIVKDLK